MAGLQVFSAPQGVPNKISVASQPAGLPAGPLKVTAPAPLPAKLPVVSQPANVPQKISVQALPPQPSINVPPRPQEPPQMDKIASDIGVARGRGADDTTILYTLVKKNPQLTEPVRIAIQERKATPSQVLDSIVQKHQPQTVDEPQQEDGFVKSLVKGAVNPLLRLGTSAYSVLQAAPKAGEAIGYSLKGDKEAAQRAAEEGMAELRPRDLPIVGKVKPVALQAPGQGAVRSFADAAGVGAELASNLVGGEGVSSVGKSLGKETLKQVVKQGAKEGLVSGAVYGLGSGLQKEDASLKSVAKDTAVSGSMGLLAGGVLSAAGYGVKKALTPKVDRVIQNRTKELDKLDSSYAVLRKQTQKAQERGFDVKRILAETDLLHGSVDNNGTIRTQNAISDLNDFIKPQEDVISRNLKKEGRKIPLQMVESELKAAVNDSGLKGGAKIRGLKNVADDIEGYKLDADKDGYISIATLHDAKVDKYANINYTNPESQRADKVIAKRLKELVERETRSVDVKKLNQELSQYYTLQGYLEKLDGKKVEGGRLGKYFAQTIGSIVGSHFGPLGSIAGAEIGGKIKGAEMASKFSGKTGIKLQQSQAMRNAIEQGKDKVIQLPAPSLLERTKEAFKNDQGGFIRLGSPQKLELQDTFDRLQQRKVQLLNQGLKESHPSVKAIAKQQQSISRQLGRQ